jgi:hypothetical protein
MRVSDPAVDLIYLAAEPLRPWSAVGVEYVIEALHAEDIPR